MLWSYTVGAPITAAPAVAEGLVVVGSEDKFVYAFGKAEETGARNEGGRP